MKELEAIYKAVGNVINRRNYSYDNGWYVNLSDVKELEALIIGMIKEKEIMENENGRKH